MSRMPREKEARKEMMLRISPEEYVKLHALCQVTHRTATALIRALIRRAELAPEPPLYVECQPEEDAHHA